MRKLAALFLFLSYSLAAQVVPGGSPSAPATPTSSIVGNLTTATGGVVTNGTLTFSLSQPAVVSGTASVASSTVSCYTSTVGNLVGVPDPLALPVVTTNTASGTLPAGTYYVKITYVGAGGQSVPSPETTVVLSAQGTLNIQAPAIQPTAATGFFNVYIGTTPGGETLQGNPGAWTTFFQSTPLVVGSALPVSNTSACNVWFSDTLIPTGTYYTVSLFNKNGSLIAGYPQTWCTYGGAGGTINVSNGAPTGNCGTNGVYYPTPIMASPANGAAQSVGGPLAVTGAFSATGGGTLSGAFAGPTALTSLNNILFADQYPSVQAAINALGGNGGTVFLQCNTSYVGPTTFPNGVRLESLCPGMYTTTLTYSSTLFMGPAQGISIKGITLNFSGTANLQIQLVAKSEFDMNVNCVTGSPCVFLTANNTGFTYQNRFDYLDITTGGQIGLSFDSANGFVTVNDFGVLLINMNRATLGSIIDAIDFNRNCDSNHFQTAHLFFTNVNAGNGVVFNDTTPTVDVDADNEVFDLVDITSGISITGTAYQVNKSAGNKWTEGFGQTSFTTPVAANSTTNFIRLQLEGGGIMMGQSGIISPAGSPVGFLTVPAVGTNLISDTAVQTLTNKTLTSPTINSPTVSTGTFSTPTITSPTFSTGISNNGSGFKHIRGVVGCTTSGGASAFTGPCTTVVTWTSAFADANYTASCMADGIALGVPILQGITAKAAASVTVQTQQASGTNAQFSAIECIAVHD
jgi:hypothetical protein